MIVDILIIIKGYFEYNPLFVIMTIINYASCNISFKNIPPEVSFGRYE